MDIGYAYPFQTALLLAPVILGAAFLAGLGAGVWADADLADLWKLDREFEPAMSRDQAGHLQSRWREAVIRSRDWARPDNQ